MAKQPGTRASFAVQARPAAPQREVAFQNDIGRAEVLDELSEMDPTRMSFVKIRTNGGGSPSGF